MNNCDLPTIDPSNNGQHSPTPEDAMEFLKGDRSLDATTTYAYKPIEKPESKVALPSDTCTPASSDGPDSVDPEVAMAFLRRKCSDAGPATGADAPTPNTDDSTFKLSVCKPDDLIAMEFDGSENLLGERLLAKKQCLVIAGPAGIGKSRFVMQLVANMIIKKQFLNFEVKNESGPCLVLQTENSTWRLKEDMARLKPCYTPEEWKKINDNLLILDKARSLNLSNPRHVKQLKELIKEHNPSIIVFDPLYTFAVGDLNTDTDMKTTCDKIEEVGFADNPNRALIILHHALTGKTGAMKAMGFDRSSYGRNSKLLYAWTRAQINLAPGSPDDNDTMVVVCAKNNNGPLFKPFAAKLNTRTMIYEVDRMFDLKKWEGEVHGRGGRKRLISSEEVAEILGDQKLTKAELAKAIMEETSCGRTTAYEAIVAADGVTLGRNKDDKKYFSLTTG